MHETFTRDQLLEASRRYVENHRAERSTYFSQSDFDAMPLEEAAQAMLAHLLSYVPAK